MEKGGREERGGREGGMQSMLVMDKYSLLFNLDKTQRVRSSPGHSAQRCPESSWPQPESNVFINTLKVS